jgi:hypothetical protein
LLPTLPQPRVLAPHHSLKKVFKPLKLLPTSISPTLRKPPHLPSRILLVLASHPILISFLFVYPNMLEVAPSEWLIVGIVGFGSRTVLDRVHSLPQSSSQPPTSSTFPIDLRTAVLFRTQVWSQVHCSPGQAAPLHVSHFSILSSSADLFKLYSGLFFPADLEEAAHTCLLQLNAYEVAGESYSDKKAELKTSIRSPLVSDTTSSRDTRQIEILLSEPSGADGGLEAEGEREEEGEGNRKQ